MNNIEIAKERCKYASEKLKESNIPHAIKNADIGHINIFYFGKCVMSFWARTGRFIYTVNFNNLKNAIKLDSDYHRGLDKCIEVYKQTFGVNNDE